ncbi:YjbH domain-containing protein [Paracoccaceae bacterium]|nr:YjbH domain-containing protein [Paracoccaceae bacterium]
MTLRLLALILTLGILLTPPASSQSAEKLTLLQDSPWIAQRLQNQLDAQGSAGMPTSDETQILSANGVVSDPSLLMQSTALSSLTPALACLRGCYASDPDPKSMTINNFGLPGIIDLPTAERLPDGELILTQQLHDSLARSGMTFQILPRLGVAFRYSGHGKNGPEANGRINHDRSFDAHLHLKDETTYFPSLALGLRDFIGTGWYSSEYVAGTKTFSNISLTAGVGYGRLAGRNKFRNPLEYVHSGFKKRDFDFVWGGIGSPHWFQGEAAPFGGITYRYGSDLTLAVEYTSDIMHIESRYLDAPSPWNLGAQYRLNNSLSLSAQYLHGSTVSIGANINLNPKRPPAGAGKETAPAPMRKRGEKYQLVSTDRSTLMAVLEVDGFEILNLAEYPEHVRVDLRNTGYRSYAQALGRASATLQRFTSDNIKRAIIVFHGRGAELSSYTVDLERVTAEQVGGLTKIGPGGTVQSIIAVPLPFDLEPQTKFAYGFGPYFTHRLFNPDLPYSAETGAELGLKYNHTQKFSISGTLRKSVFTSFTQNKRLGGGGALPKVQSNWGYYDIEGQDGHIHDFKFSYVDRISSNIFARAHGGLLEPMFAGVGGEILYLSKSLPFALGVDLHRVRQRDFDMRFDLQDYETTVGKASLYFDNGGPLNIEINVGRYLAGDWGATTKLSRRFANGWEVGAYATFTDVPFHVFGEGSFDKGIYVDIPLDWLTGSPSMSRRNFTIRPITRDGGARLASGRQLFKMVRNAQEKQIKQEIGRIWK